MFHRHWIVAIFAIFGTMEINYTMASPWKNKSIISYQVPKKDVFLARSCYDIRGGSLEEISTMEDLVPILEQAEKDDKLVVLYFTATGCTPCQKVAPIVMEMSENDSEFEEDKVEFLKVNVMNSDESMNIAKYFDVDGWPTFLFIKYGNVQETIVGGNNAMLNLYNTVSKYYSL